MKEITIKQTNILVPIGAGIVTRCENEKGFSFIYNGMWFGYYSPCCFKSVISLKDGVVFKTRFRVIGWLHGKFFLFKRIRTMYLIGDNGDLLPIKTEFVN